MANFVGRESWEQNLKNKLFPTKESENLILSERIKGVKVVESKDFPAKQGESLILLE